MKFGFRKPSLKKIISAMTKTQLTKGIKRVILPEYGKRSKGYYTSIKKSAYNMLYNHTTVGVSDLISAPLTKQRNNTVLNYRKDPMVISSKLYNEQIKKFEDFSSQIIKLYFPPIGKSQHPIYSINAQFISLFYEYKREDINMLLFDYLEIKISEKLKKLTKSYTIKKYKLALQIINALKLDVNIEEILQRLYHIG